MPIGSRTHSGRAAWLQRGGLVMAAGIGSGMLLWWWAPTAPMHTDTLEDLALARSCYEGGACSPHASSQAGFEHGRLLLYLLALGWRLDVEPVALHVLNVLLHALATAVVAAAIVRRKGLVAAAAAAVLAAWLFPTASGYPVLWNPSLAPLPLAVFAVALAALAVEGHVLWGVVAGAALALAAHGHVVHAALLPLLATVAAATARSATAAMLAVVTPLGMWALIDAKTALQNFEALHESIGGIIVLATVPIGALVGGLLRTRLSALSPDRRWSLGLSLPPMAVCAGVVFIAPVVGKPPALRYAAAAMPGLAVLAGLAVCWLAGRSAAYRTAGLAVLVLLAVGVAVVRSESASRSADDLDRPTLGDAKAIAQHFAEQGVGYAEAREVVWGPRREALLSAMVVWTAEPWGSSAGADRAERGVRVVPGVSAGDLPDGWTRHTLREGFAIAVAGSDGRWVDVDRYRTCAGQGDGIQCATVDAQARTASETLPRHRATVTELEEWPATAPRGPVRQHFQVRAGEGGRRVILLGHGWMLDGAQGVTARQVSGRLVELEAARRARGTLVLRLQSGLGFAPPLFPGIWLQLTPAEQDALQLR